MSFSPVSMPRSAGNSLPLRNIPQGSIVHCVEMKPGKGAQMIRAGASAQLVARDGAYVTLRLRSGEMRKVLADCRATLAKFLTASTTCALCAGAKRWRGVRPTVRCCYEPG